MTATAVLEQCSRPKTYQKPHNVASCNKMRESEGAFKHHCPLPLFCIFPLFHPSPANLCESMCEHALLLAYYAALLLQGG